MSSNDNYYVDDEGNEYDSYEDFLDAEQERENRAIETGNWECPCGALHPPPQCRR